MPFLTQSKGALAAIKSAGILLTFTQTADTYNTATQTVLHVSTVYQMWCVVVKPISGGASLGEDYDKNSTTVDYQQGLIAAAYGVVVTPRVGDTLVLFGNKWTIMEKGNIEPDGISIIYKLSIRRG